MIAASGEADCSFWCDSFARFCVSFEGVLCILRILRLQCLRIHNTHILRVLRSVYFVSVICCLSFLGKILPSCITIE